MDLLDSILSSIDETATQQVLGGTKQERGTCLPHHYVS